MDLTTTYPSWLILLSIVAGILISLLLYYKNKRFELSFPTNITLGVIRAIIISFIAFLLLNPLIESQKRFTEKPVILFLQDNSSSVKTSKDSTYYLTDYVQQIKRFSNDLEKKYDVASFVFDDQLHDDLNIDFKGAITDFSSVLKDVKNRFAYRNIGAMIIASDGIYNRGSNPVYDIDKFNFPIYTIALGDTNIQRDIILKKVNFNRIAYLGNEFPMEITIQAGKCKDQQTRLTVVNDGNDLFSKTIHINSNNFLQTEKLLLEANTKGLQRYTIELTPVNDEISKANNKQDVFIDILEGKQKILILSGVPHPDVSAIKQAILSNKNYEVQDFMIDKFDQSVEAYNLVILHGLPSLKSNITGLLNQIREKQIPVLYFLTKNTYYRLFNDQLAGVSVRGENLIFNEVMPSVNEKFSLFTIGDQTREMLKSTPPVVSPYGSINIQASATPLLFQTIGSIETEDPLLVLSESTNQKTGVVLAEGLWRWRLKSWAQKGTHEPFDQLINKIVQFLSLKVDKRFFKVIHDNNFNENQDIEMDAQVYNEIYELINEPEVKIIFTDEMGNDFPFVFNKTINAYHLNTGRLPAGNYKYKATVQLGDKLLTENGEFTVNPLNIELINTIADHNLLFNMAHNRGGEMFYPNQLDELEKTIIDSNKIKTISYRESRFSELLNIPWLLGLVILLLSIEWLVRKRMGAY